MNFPGSRNKRTMVKQHVHANTSARRVTRIAITVDTVLREHLHLPARTGLINNKPISIEECIDFLNNVVNNNDNERTDRPRGSSTGQEPKYNASDHGVETRSSGP